MLGSSSFQKPRDFAVSKSTSLFCTRDFNASFIASGEVISSRILCQASGVVLRYVSVSSVCLVSIGSNLMQASSRASQNISVGHIVVRPGALGSNRWLKSEKNKALIVSVLPRENSAKNANTNWSFLKISLMSYSLSSCKGSVASE